MSTLETRPANQLRILIAIPGTELASSVVAVLHGMGIHHVRKVHDSGAAMSLLGMETFDAMLIDAGLTPEDGTAFTRRLRAMSENPNRSIAVVMMSGATDKKRIEAARDAGIHEFVRLPASAEIIGSRLKSAVTAPRAFVEADGYAGPDRRRQTKAGPGPERRTKRTEPG